MDADEYQVANLQVALIANTIEQLPLADMREAQERAGAIGPLLDPTRYIEKAEDFRVDCERTRILRHAQIELRALRAKHETKARG